MPRWGEKENPRDYISSRVLVEDRGYISPCWIWQLGLTEKGYGRAKVPVIGKARVHRAAYQIHKGAIPEGLDLDHLCLVKACCNPDHLEPVTAAENNRRARAAGLHLDVRKMTHCLRGHTLTPENRSPKGSCRACHRADVRRWQENHPDQYKAKNRFYAARRRARLSGSV